MKIFKKNRLAGHVNYVRSGEVVPHFFSKGSYYLYRDGDDLFAKPNACIHRGTKLISERQRASKITCRLHRWEYDVNGTLLSDGSDQCRQAQLGNRIQLENIGGLFFEYDSIRSIKGIETFTDMIAEKLAIKISDYVFDQESITFYHSQWEPYVELFLDDKRIRAREKDGSLYDVSKLLIGSEAELHSSQEWQLRVHSYDKKWVAAFGLIYPGLMIHFYQGGMVINQIVPLSDKLLASYIQFYFHKDSMSDVVAQNLILDTYAETAQHDGVLLELLNEGRDTGWRYSSNDRDINDSIKLFETWKLTA